MEHKNLEEKFASRLSQVITSLGPNFTKKIIAKEIGVKPQTLISWEKKKAFPRVETLYDLSRFFNRPMEWFLGDEMGGHFQVEESVGIKWRVLKPYDIDKGKLAIIEKGVKLFEYIVKNKWTYSQIRETEEFPDSQEFKIKRLLSAALHSRSVEILEVQRNEEKEKILQNLFGKENLLQCIVAKTDGLPLSELITDTIRLEAVGFLAAGFPIDTLPEGGSVGLGGGTTVSRFVDLVTPWAKLAGTTWVPLLATKGTLTSTTYYASENNIVARMLAKHPGAKGLELPYLTDEQRDSRDLSSISGDSNTIINHARWVLDLAKKVDTAFISVGPSDFPFRATEAYEGLQYIKALITHLPDDEKEKNVGHILYRFIDKNGARIGSKESQDALDKLIYSISLDDLTRITERGLVWILAAHPKKAQIIKAALMSNRANALIIDSIVADELIKLFKNDLKLK